MKARWITIPTTALMIISAGKALTTGVPATEAPVAEVQTNQTLAPEALARKSDCLQCHSVDKKIVGPAYKDIAARYKGNAGAQAALIKTVMNGGKGNWTDVTDGGSMPPHSARLSDAEVKRLVDWVLSR